MYIPVDRKKKATMCYVCVNYSRPLHRYVMASRRAREIRVLVDANF